jgi:hypothetical protein
MDSMYTLHKIGIRHVHVANQRVHLLQDRVAFFSREDDAYQVAHAQSAHDSHRVAV